MNEKQVFQTCSKLRWHLKWGISRRITSLCMCMTCVCL